MSASVSQYVLKVFGRCDLSCDHCYVYEHADQSWRVKPKALNQATARQAATRISEHAWIHELDKVHVVLHGGEPLLLGHDGLGEILGTLRSVIEPVARLDIRVHTNGVLLDKRLCGLFADYDVQVGVSLDGDRSANDRHRRFSDGRSSHPHVRRALALLRRSEYRHLYAGILCTVDVENDPIAVYEALLAEAPPRIDLLLPHATWDHPPFRPPGVPVPYAAWLARIHSRWVADGCPVPIRFFDSLIAAWEGRPSQSEAVGLDPVDLLVIETDGSWEQADSLKTAFEGAPATSLNVFSHSADEAMAHPGVSTRQAGLAALCRSCRECPVVQACGGGLYAHRFKLGNGFDNPSVYCADLKVLIPRIVAKPLKAVTAPGGDRVTGHFLPDGAFDLLSAGPGNASAMASLADSHWSVTRALVATVASGLEGRSDDLSRAAAEGWTLLSALDALRPGAVREVLTYPYVQAWAVRCLRPSKSADFDLDCAHLAGLAAAAALRAGIDAELPLPVRGGSIYLPTMGALAVDTGPGRTSAVRLSPSGLSSRRAIRGWQTARRLTAPGMSVTVEDTDPFRDCQSWTATGRLSAGTWKDWRIALAAAAGLLAVELPGYASVIGVGLRSVVPILPGPDGYRQSGTARHAFGALAIAFPDNVEALSVLLVHEMQHVKLGALCDLFDLFDRADDRVFQVPWREDHRPIEGVLQGTYAHLAIAELWRSRATRAPAGPAGPLFRKYRRWVGDAIDTLLNSDALMPDGKRFVHGMRSTVEGWDR